MKKSIRTAVVALVVASALAGWVQANPTIRPRGGPDEVEQSPDAGDLSTSERVSHLLATSPALAETHGDISVITTTDHLILLRGMVATDEDHDRIMAVLRPEVGSYKVEDDLGTTEE